ncbi:MAG: hypothetical protein E6R03_17140, partial [Hyphomicrobiaceae bacterium]
MVGIAVLERIFSSIRSAAPPIPPLPTGAAVCFPEEDSEDCLPQKIPVSATKGDSGAFIHIRYTDSAGACSARRITVLGLDASSSGACLLRAWCHERRASRAFRLDRISEAHDPATGEVYETSEAIRTFVEKISHVSPESETERALKENKHALNILVYLARCDGTYHPDEEDVIAHYMADMCYERDIDEDALLRHVRRLCPTADIFHASCAALMRSKDINRFLRYAIQLIEADGIIDDREFSAFHEIEDTKETTPPRKRRRPEHRESVTLDFFSFQKVFAIDFETANKSQNSAIALGLAAIDAGNRKVLEARSWLIRPPRMVFNPDFIEIHKIRPEDVASQPTFGDLWSEIAPLLGGAWLVAHNAAF